MNRTDQLAQLIADGMTVADAGRAMSLTKGQTSNLWNKIKRNLGVQAV